MTRRIKRWEKKKSKNSQPLPYEGLGLFYLENFLLPQPYTLGAELGLVVATNKWCGHALSSLKSTSRVRTWRARGLCGRRKGKATRGHVEVFGGADEQIWLVVLYEGCATQPYLAILHLHTPQAAWSGCTIARSWRTCMSNDVIG